MNKTELVKSVQEKTGLSKDNSHKAVDAVIESIIETLKDGKEVSLIGFGTFKVKDRKERKGRNPITKEEITIPATRVASFSVGKSLKDAVAATNKKKAAKKKK
ncbi:MAG: HU family DNA-binding protein [Ruminobacter sp.]|jgi:nucleoid DNA-binding protein|nr:HU family DNA-binding protein [Ruminobacter sp.]MBR1924632.1 HU family DNA-binding protein [Ruminobacter sp.]